MVDEVLARHELLERMVSEQPSRLPAKMRAAGFRSQEAEDLAQDTLLKAVRSVADIRGPVTEALLCGWVDRIAVNTVLNSRRDAARRPTVRPLDLMDAIHTNVPDIAEDMAHLEALRWLLIQLPKGQRVVFVGLALDDKSVKEMATELGLREDTVRWRYRRARQRLAALLDDLTPDDGHGGSCCSP